MKKEFNIKLNPKNVLLGLLVAYSLFTSFMWYDEYSHNKTLERLSLQDLDDNARLNLENTELKQQLRNIR